MSFSCGPPIDYIPRRHHLFTRSRSFKQVIDRINAGWAIDEIEDWLIESYASMMNSLAEEE